MANSPSVGPVIVCVPQGAGKSQHAEALRSMFGMRCVVDGWDGRSPLPNDVLALTNQPWPGGCETADDAGEAPDSEAA